MSVADFWLEDWLLLLRKVFAILLKKIGAEYVILSNQYYEIFHINIDCARNLVGLLGGRVMKLVN